MRSQNDQAKIKIVALGLMVKQERWSWLAIFLAFIALVAAIMKRDAGIQADREYSATLIRAYEQNVRKAHDELKALESQPIVLAILEDIATLQMKIVEKSNQLINLSPAPKSPGNPQKVNQYSQADVEAFNARATAYNKWQQAYNNNITTYQSFMSQLNDVIDLANRQYEIKIIRPLELDRASLSTDRKFLEFIGIIPTPQIQPSPHIDRINSGIASRYEKQKNLRDNWNSKAKIINETTRNINSLFDEIIKLYRAPFGGIRINKVKDLKTSN